VGSLVKGSGRLVAAAVVGVLLVGGGAVWADGGDTGLVHGCVTDLAGFDQPNVRIVDANESCPPDFESIHWPASAEDVIAELTPAEEPPPSDAESTYSDVSPDKAVIKKVYKKLGVKPGLTKTVSKTVGQDNTHYKTASVECPGSHPFLMSGGYKVTGGYVGFKVLIYNEPVGLHAWTTGVAIYGQGNWGLVVSAVCAKVKPTRSSGRS
jgi:hypothetical protein